MEWEPNERDAWVSDAQRWITQIKGVLQCKIDLDDQGEIAGIHVVAGLERDPRHIVRDVESLLKARLQLDVYYKKIGVVQVVESPRPDPHVAHGVDREPSVVAAGVTFLPPHAEAPRPVAPPKPAMAPEASEPPAAPVPAVLVAEDAFPRPTCRGVSLLSSDRSVRAEVVLAAGGREAAGVAESAGHADADLNCIARATVEAVGLLLALPVVLHLREIRLDTIGGQATVLAAVDLVESRRTETLLGACALRHNRQQAVVHAVLAALNRRLGLFAVREAEAAD
ncbi:MAG: hypothetical protein IPK64_08180 [bacterium]|nr:hypothetical protein [bacterium]